MTMGWEIGYIPISHEVRNGGKTVSSMTATIISDLGIDIAMELDIRNVCSSW